MQWLDKMFTRDRVYLFNCNFIFGASLCIKWFVNFYITSYKMTENNCNPRKKYVNKWNALKNKTKNITLWVDVKKKFWKVNIPVLALKWVIQILNFLFIHFNLECLVTLCTWCITLWVFFSSSFCLFSFLSFPILIYCHVYYIMVLLWLKMWKNNFKF